MQKTEYQVVTYYWYDRGEIRGTEDEKIIENAIESHDFETFVKMREKYPPDTDEGFEYFPDEAAVYDIMKEDFIDWIDITNPENFNLIDENEYEWG